MELFFIGGLEWSMNTQITSVPKAPEGDQLFEST